MHVHTPTIHSATLSAHLGRHITLKMETAQPTGSFKLRGIGRFCQRAIESGAERLVSSSGGNAGLAAAWSARMLDTPITVVVPETTPHWMRDRIRAEGAEVIVHGAVWDAAHRHAQTLDGALVHPFDHPDIWDGHSTLIDEAAAVIPAPGAVVVSVGGGGLLCGVLTGMHRAGWHEVPVLAVETEGAASYKAALDAGRPVDIGAITSVAKTLGARKVCANAVQWARKHPVTSCLVTDAAALSACTRFETDHAVRVAPSCGAALSVIYDRSERLAQTTGRVLVVVCGGASREHSDIRMPPC